MLFRSLLMRPRAATVAGVAGALGVVLMSTSLVAAATLNTLSIAGSTTVFPVAQNIYNNVYSTSPVGRDVAVQGAPGQGAGIGQGGSGFGVNNLMLGNLDVADSSRPLTCGPNGPADPSCATSGDNNVTNGILCAITPVPLPATGRCSRGADVDAWVIGKDGITITVNTSSLGASAIVSTGLTVQNLADIFSCRVLNWQQINPAFPNQAIVAATRQDNSGTRGDYLNFIGVPKGTASQSGVPSANSEELCFGNATQPARDANHVRAIGNPGLQQFVTTTPGAITYTGLGFADDPRQTKVPIGGLLFSGSCSSDGLTCTGTYPPGGQTTVPTVASIDAQVAALSGGAPCSGTNPCYVFGRQLFMITIKPDRVTKAGLPAARAANHSKAMAFIQAALSRDGQQQLVNEGEAGLTTRPCTPNPSCTNTLQNGVTAQAAVLLTPVGGGATQQVNPQIIPATDVNGDRSIDIADVSSVGSGGIWQSNGPTGGFCVGTPPFTATNPADPSCGWIDQDVNRDGHVDITDISAIGGQWQVPWQQWVL